MHGRTASLQKAGAAINWRAAQQKRDPDFFVVPFAPPDHERYLTTPVWHCIRAKVLQKAEHRCAGCSAKPQQTTCSLRRLFDDLVGKSWRDAQVEHPSAWLDRHCRRPNSLHNRRHSAPRLGRATLLSF